MGSSLDVVCEFLSEIILLDNMKAQQGLALLAIATILIVAKIRNIEAIPSKPKPGTSLKGRNTDFPKRMMDLQTKIDDTITNTRKKINEAGKEINRTRIQLGEKISKESSDARKTVIIKGKKDNKKKENNKNIDNCTKKEHSLYGLSLDHSLETALECVNETSENSLENIKKIKQDLNDSYGIKDGHGPLNTQWFTCVFEETNACEQKYLDDINKRIQVTSKSSAEILAKVATVKKEHKDSIEQCLDTYHEGLKTDLDNYNKGLKTCNDKKN